MQANTNMQDMNINIQAYLNLGSSPCIPPLYEHHIDQLQQPCELLLDNNQSSMMESQILLCQKRGSRKTIRQTQASEVGSVSQKKSAKQATAKYRQRRKQYQQQLQYQVKCLEQQLNKTETEIGQVKDSLLQKLESSIKSVHSTQNAQIYHELETCLPKQGEDEQLVDIDKINLLLNTLKFRIGPTGRQRHAKIEYNFKNIVNTLFPGLLRYFIITAAQGKDFFGPNPQCQLPWTRQLIQKLNITPFQKQQIEQSKQKLKIMHECTMNKISRLKTIKHKIKQQALLMDKQEDGIRQSMSPVQCAKLTMFCQRHKYRKNIALDQKFRLKNYGTMIEEEMEELLQYKLGRKRVHLSQN